MEPTRQAETFDLRGPRGVVRLKANHPLKLMLNVHNITLNTFTKFYIKNEFVYCQIFLFN